MRNHQEINITRLSLDSKNLRITALRYSGSGSLGSIDAVDPVRLKLGAGLLGERDGL